MVPTEDDSIKPAWTQEQVDALNTWQNSRYVHPFTCGNNRGNNRGDEKHRQYAEEHGGDWGQLVATTEGWICPVPGCGYTQKWAHGFMANPNVVAELNKGPF